MHFGQILARIQDSDMSSQFGDVWVWTADYDEPPCLMLQEAIKMAPWWAKRLVHAARFRPDDVKPKSGNPYNQGTFTVFFRLPGQWLGPYLTRSRRVVDGEYFKWNADF